MIILISPENDIPKEIATLHQLFKAGLEFYHFRKPNKSIDEHRSYISAIDPQFRNRIVTHNFHELAQEFTFKGIHLEERIWREKENNLGDYVSDFQNNGFSVSSSYHEPTDLESQKVEFDYYMLSPVFAAISKPGYKGRGFKVQHIPKKIVGMGGINAQTTPEARALGFTGVGVLGGVWNAKNPLEAFTDLQKAYLNTI